MTLSKTANSVSGFQSNKERKTKRTNGERWLQLGSVQPAKSPHSARFEHLRVSFKR